MYIPSSASERPRRGGKTRITRGNTRLAEIIRAPEERLRPLFPSLFRRELSDDVLSLGVRWPARGILSLLKLFAPTASGIPPLPFSRRKKIRNVRMLYIANVTAWTDRENNATSCPRFQHFTAEKSSYTRNKESRVNRVLHRGNLLRLLR